MTIRRNLDLKALNERLSNFEACAQNAPRGTYEREKDIVQLLGLICDDFLQDCKMLGLVAPNCDQIREVQAVLYGFIAEANPEAVAAAEGFGAAMETPARDRIIKQAAQMRDFLAAIPKGNA